MRFIDYTVAQRVKGTHNRALGAIMPIFDQTLSPPYWYAVTNQTPPRRRMLAFRVDAEQWVAAQYPSHQRLRKHR